MDRGEEAGLQEEEEEEEGGDEEERVLSAELGLRLCRSRLNQPAITGSQSLAQNCSQGVRFGQRDTSALGFGEEENLPGASRREKMQHVHSEA